MSRFTPLLSFALLVLFQPGLVAAQADDAPLPAELQDQARQLQTQARESELAWSLTEELLTQVGPRFAGTDGGEAAVGWALTRLRQLGFSNIEAEQVSVPRWVRGETDVAISSPHPQPLVAVALGGSIGTPEAGIEAPVVQVEDVEALESLPRSEVEGHIVYFSKRMERRRDPSGYGETVANRSRGPAAAAEKGAVATVIRSIGTSDARIAHTGITIFPDDVKRIPAAALSNPDADLLERQLASGRPVTMTLRMTARDLDPGLSANVIGEIPGSDPDAGVVLLGAHLDSWDITPGAHDAAAPVAIVTAAARLIADFDEQPRRTIRVVLFANEENGLSGARAYAENREDKIEEHFLGVGADLGAAPVWRFDSRVAEDSLPLIEAMHALIEPLGVELGNNQARGIPDFSPLREAGMPLLGPLQDARPYFDVHHSRNDTLDKIDPESLQQNVAIYTTLAWIAANVDAELRPVPESEQ